MAPITMRYFAYGSNLWMQQMMERCPSSIPMERAILRDHKLVYRRNPRGIGVADIIPCKGSKVYGAIYHVTPKDLGSLDKFEGVPFVYNRKSVTVEARSGMVGCITYCMNSVYTYQMPTKEYFKKIHRGYEDWCLPQFYLEAELKAFKVEAKNKKNKMLIY